MTTPTPGHPDEQGHYEDTADEPREHEHADKQGHYEDTADEPREHEHPDKQGHYEDTADEPREHEHPDKQGHYEDTAEKPTSPSAGSGPAERTARRALGPADQPKSVSMNARDRVAMGGGAVMSAVILGSGWV